MDNNIYKPSQVTTAFPGLRVLNLDAVSLGIYRSPGWKQMANGIKTTSVEIGAPPQEMEDVSIFGVSLTVLQE